MRFKLLLLSVMALAMTSSQAMAFELTGSLDAHLDPVLEISRDDTGITVDYTFNGACQSEDDLYPVHSTSVSPASVSTANPEKAHG